MTHAVCLCCVLMALMSVLMAQAHLVLFIILEEAVHAGGACLDWKVWELRCHKIESVGWCYTIENHTAGRPQRQAGQSPIKKHSSVMHK
jgi:hypothetical protein